MHDPGFGDDGLPTRVSASVRRALVGGIAPEILAVEVEWSPERLLVRVFAEEAAPDAVREDFDADVMTQIVSDFPYPDRGDPAVVLEWRRGAAPSAMGAARVFVRTEVS